MHMLIGSHPRAAGCCPDLLLLQDSRSTPHSWCLFFCWISLAAVLGHLSLNAVSGGLLGILDVWQRCALCLGSWWHKLRLRGICTEQVAFLGWECFELLLTARPRTQRGPSSKCCRIEAQYRWVLYRGAALNYRMLWEIMLDQPLLEL